YQVHSSSSKGLRTSLDIRAGNAMHYRCGPPVAPPRIRMGRWERTSPRSWPRDRTRGGRRGSRQGTLRPSHEERALRSIRIHSVRATIGHRVRTKEGARARHHGLGHESGGTALLETPKRELTMATRKTKSRGSLAEYYERHGVLNEIVDAPVEFSLED